MKTGEEYATIAKQRYSKKIIEAFKAYVSYSQKLEYDKHNNKQGQNRNSTVLYRKFHQLCMNEEIDVTCASAILGHASDYL